MYMEKKQWKYHAEDGEEWIPYLHDCVAEEIRQNGSELTLVLPDGFWLLDDDPRNPYGEIRKTGPAEVVVSLGYPRPQEDVDDAVTLELFRYHRLFRGVGFTTCTYPKSADLIEKVNRGKWKIEFVSKYQHYSRGYLIDCCVHAGRRMHKCYASVECRGTQFFWDEVLEDRVW